MIAMIMPLPVAPGLRPSAPTYTSIVCLPSNVPFSPSAKRSASCPCLTLFSHSVPFGVRQSQTSAFADILTPRFRRNPRSGRTCPCLLCIHPFFGSSTSGKGKKHHPKPGGAYGQKPRRRRKRYLSYPSRPWSAADKAAFPGSGFGGQEHAILTKPKEVS